MSTLLAFIMFGIWLYGLWSLLRLAYIKSVGLRHKAVNHKALRQAVVLDDIERALQDDEHKLWPDREFDHINCTICGPGPLLQGVVPSRFQHPFFIKEKEQRSDGYGSWMIEVLRPARAEYATMVSSQIVADGVYTGDHTLMLDIDLPATLVQSTSTGHHHLYIDHAMSWRAYRSVLKAMSAAGLIEKGYYRAAVRQSATMLRPPWVKKPFNPPDMTGTVVMKAKGLKAKWNDNKRGR